MAEQSNVDVLCDAGLLTSPVQDDLAAKVNQLSRDEVNTLVAVQQKLGFSGSINHPHGVAECAF